MAPGTYFAKLRGTYPLYDFLGASDIEMSGEE
jgi:hypothetical protein